MIYTVKETAKLLNMSEHTLRYYTDKNLVPAIKRDDKNNRLFDEEALNWLIGIKYLKGCGMSLHDIKKYIDLCLLEDDTLQQRYEIIKKQQKIAEEQLKEAELRVAYMNNKVDYYKKLLDNHIDGANPSNFSLGENEDCLQPFLNTDNTI